MTQRPDVGRLVQRHRDAAGLTQDELARRAGLHQSTLSAIERNLRCPTIGTLCRLLGVLDLQLELGVTDRAASLDAAIDAAARTPMADRLRRGRLDGVAILAKLAEVSPVVEGAAGAALHGAPVDVDRLDVAVAGAELPALARALRSLAADRWSEQYRMWGPADPDPAKPGSMRWLTVAGEIRLRLVDELPDALTVLVGDRLVRVRPLHEIEAEDDRTARVLIRLRQRTPAA